MTLFDLTGRVAVVTGGNGGIGFGMAEGLAGAGASVMIAGRNPEKGAAALAALRKGGGSADFCETDVTDEAACHALVARTKERFGRLDILINNAGTNIRYPPDKVSLADWHAVLDANLTSALLCSQAAYPEMIKAGRGKVINIGSMLSIFGASYGPAYGASKGAIVQFTRSCAVAWAKDNIQVNAVLPGWVDTDLTRGAREQVPGLHERVLARTPAGRWGTPADLAGVAVFLASAASDFVTGAAVPVDGGFSVLG
jgi:2-deoxy-D-gluconate 3-dehydrogenase